VIIIIVLKPDLEVNLGQGLGYRARGLTWVNVWVKVITIIFLNLDSRVDYGQRLGHGLEELTQVDSKFFF
jgi:hypothetical protein